MSKRQRGVVIDRLRSRKKSLQRQIDKMNGHRELIKWYFKEGETWRASSFDGPLDAPQAVSFRLIEDGE